LKRILHLKVLPEHLADNQSLLQLITQLRIKFDSDFELDSQLDSVLPSASDTLNHCESLIEGGAIYLNGARILQDRVLSPGDTLRIHWQPKHFPVDHIDIQDNLIEETKDYLLINKPAGLPVHATLDNAHENLISLVKKLGHNCLPTQRLDIPTEGLLLLAKTLDFHNQFKKQNDRGLVKKTYLVLTEKEPKQGELSSYMSPEKRTPRVLSQSPNPGWKHCVLEILSVKQRGHLFESQVLLKTGRTHQIRAQFAEQKHPIFNDDIYGERKIPKEQIGLQSQQLEFQYKEKIKVFKIASLDFSKLK